MLETIIVALIVAAAAYIAVKKVATQLKGQGCNGGNCSCSSKRPENETVSRKS